MFYSKSKNTLFYAIITTEDERWKDGISQGFELFDFMFSTNNSFEQNVPIFEWYSLQLLSTFSSNYLRSFKNMCAFHTP